jgi:excisionase family DNA binding protein
MDKMTAIAAAELLNITPYSVYRLIKAGKLLAEKFGTVWMVDKDSVQDYKERNKGKAQNDPTRG